MIIYCVQVFKSTVCSGYNVQCSGVLLYILQQLQCAVCRLDHTRSQEAYMDKSESWVMSPGTRLASQGRNGLD